MTEYFSKPGKFSADMKNVEDSMEYFQWNWLLKNPTYQQEIGYLKRENYKILNEKVKIAFHKMTAKNIFMQRRKAWQWDEIFISHDQIQRTGCRLLEELLRLMIYLNGTK